MSQKTMTRPRTEPVARVSADVTADRLADFQRLFPDVFIEGKVDFNKLRSALGDAAVSGPERFIFSWAGRSDAVATLQTPSRATLVPCPDESVNFDTTRNLFVEGDNLEVLKLLYKAYHQKVKLIYIDPPYNTGQDFVYPDDFRDPLATYLQLTGQTDAAGNLLTSNPETSGRYHSAWLSMMYPRLFLARQLLRDDGVIFVSIDDHEVHHLRVLMNEVFGEENFVGMIAWQKKDSPSNDAKGISITHEYVAIYQRSEEFNRQLLPRTEEQLGNYKNPDNDERGPWTRTTLYRKEVRKDRCFELTNPKGRTIAPPPGTSWRVDPETFAKYSRENRIWWGSDGDGDLPFLKRFLTEVAEGVVPVSWWDYKFAGSNRNATVDLRDLFEREIPFETPKPTLLVRRMLQVATSNADSDVILDFFAGSCTTAQAVLELNREDAGNRRFVMVQLPERTGNKKFPTIADIGKERIRRVIAKLKNETGNIFHGEPSRVSGRVEPAAGGTRPLTGLGSPENGSPENGSPGVGSPENGSPSPGSPDVAEDLGFKVFKLAESHFETWSGVPEREPAKYHETMSLFRDPLKAGWTPEGVLWEVAVKEGYGLNCRIERVENPATDGARLAEPAPDGARLARDRLAKDRLANVVYRVIDPEKEPPQSFRACLDGTIDPDIAKVLELGTNDLFVVRDRALDDTLAANLSLQCRLKTI